MWTEIIDLVVLGRKYWSSCRVLNELSVTYTRFTSELQVMSLFYT